MANNIDPPPLQDMKDFPFTLQEWFRKIWKIANSSVTGTVTWAGIDKTGSNISDIVTRTHNSLQSMQGGTSNEYYHQTADQNGYTVSLTGQTASIGTTAITTPTAAGVWDIDVYHVCTTAGTGGTLTTTISWNDGTAARSASPAANISLAGTNFAGGIQCIRGAASNAINYSTTVAGATGSPQYALYIVARKRS